MVANRTNGNPNTNLGSQTPPGNPGPGTIRLGVGLSMWHGILAEEKLIQLRPFSRRMATYEEILDDATVGTLFDAIKVGLLASPFSVRPYSQSERDLLRAQFLRDNIDNMEGMKWPTHVDDMLDHIPYGFSISEKVMRKKDEDGTIRLRALVPIGQETLYRWGEPDELGRVTSFEQRLPTQSPINVAPIDKLLHFTFRARKRNPEGRGLLRSLYRPWYFKKNLEVIEAIGAERDVGNSPVVTLKEGEYDPASITVLENGLKAFRMDQNTYVILPPGMEMQAYGSGGKVYDVREMIKDWQHVIFRRFFADFLQLGGERVGTQALAREVTSFFVLSLRSIQGSMMEVWNDQLVPWIFGWNPSLVDSIEKLPTIQWQRPGKQNIQALATTLSTLVDAGMLTPDNDLEDWIRELVDAPHRDTDNEDFDPEVRLERTNAGRLDRTIARNVNGTGKEEPNPVSGSTQQRQRGEAPEDGNG